MRFDLDPNELHVPFGGDAGRLARGWVSGISHNKDCEPDATKTSLVWGACAGACARARELIGRLRVKRLGCGLCDVALTHVLLGLEA